jgi:hypothetical protein
MTIYDKYIIPSISICSRSASPLNSPNDILEEYTIPNISLSSQYTTLADNSILSLSPSRGLHIDIDDTLSDILQAAGI